MRRALFIVFVGLVVVGAASNSNHSKTQTTTATTPPPTPAAHHDAPRPHSSLRHCDPNIRANAHTSCPFAENVFVAFVGKLEAEGTIAVYAIEANSPETGHSYQMSCSLHGDQSTVIRCHNATDALVEFPLHAAVAYEKPIAPQESAPPAEEGAGEGGEDEVGSSSHATDAEFCAEHECIGSFDTEEGTIVECSDGTYSHAGGISGACSSHGGEE